MLSAWSPRDRKLVNHWASDHTQTLAGGTPILALDMYEHAYQMDYGAKAAAYVETFMSVVRWSNADRLFDCSGAVTERRGPMSNNALMRELIALLATIGGWSMAGTAVAADDCKICREYHQACVKAHPAGACKNEYDICMKHCQKK